MFLQLKEKLKQLFSLFSHKCVWRCFDFTFEYPIKKREAAATGGGNISPVFSKLNDLEWFLFRFAINFTANMKFRLKRWLRELEFTVWCRKVEKLTEKCLNFILMHFQSASKAQSYRKAFESFFAIHSLKTCHPNNTANNKNVDCILNKFHPINSLIQLFFFSADNHCTSSVWFSGLHVGTNSRKLPSHDLHHFRLLRSVSVQIEIFSIGKFTPLSINKLSS